MEKLRVATVVGTRPEIIRLSETIRLSRKVFDHTLIHTGQNYSPSLNSSFFDDLELEPPEVILDCDVSSDLALIGDTIKKSGEVFQQIKPDAIIVLGDTNSAMCSISAKKMGIPIFHLEAGNRSFDENVPEEINRRLVDHIADFNLAYNQYSKANLLREGIEPRRILISGSPMREILMAQEQKIRKSTILERLGVEEGQYAVLSTHRQENVDFTDRLTIILSEVEDLAREYSMRVIFSAHPRVAERARSIIKARPFRHIDLHEPFNFTDYVRLQEGAFTVISDSGTISEESAILGFNAITLRDSMERPEALDFGTVGMASVTKGSLVERVRIGMSLPPQISHVPDGYEVRDFSKRVVRAVSSLAPLSNVWSGRRV